MEALSFKLLELITLERQEFLLEEMSMTDFFDDVGKTVQTNAEKRGVELSYRFRRDMYALNMICSRRLY